MEWRFYISFIVLFLSNFSQITVFVTASPDQAKVTPKDLELWNALDALNDTVYYQKTVTEELVARVRQLEDDKQTLQNKVKRLEEKVDGYETRPLETRGGLISTHLHQRQKKRSERSTRVDKYTQQIQVLLNDNQLAFASIMQNTYSITNLTKDIEKLRLNISNISTMNGNARELEMLQNTSTAVLKTLEQLSAQENATSHRSIETQELVHKLNSSLYEHETMQANNLQQRVNSLEKQLTGLVKITNKLTNNLTTLAHDNNLTMTSIQAVTANISQINAVCIHENELLVKNISRRLDDVQRQCQDSQKYEQEMTKNFTMNFEVLRANLSDAWLDLKNKNGTIQSLTSLVGQLETNISKVQNDCKQYQSYADDTLKALSHNVSLDESAIRSTESVVGNLSKIVDNLKSQLATTVNVSHDALSSVDHAILTLTENVTQQGRQLAHQSNILNIFARNISSYELLAGNLSISISGVQLHLLRVENNTNDSLNILGKQLNTVVSNLTQHQQELQQQKDAISDLAMNISQNEALTRDIPGRIASLQVQLVATANVTNSSLSRLDHVVHNMADDLANQNKTLLGQGDILTSMAENISRNAAFSQETTLITKNISEQLGRLQIEYQNVQTDERNFADNLTMKMNVLTNNVSVTWQDLRSKDDAIHSLTAAIIQLESNFSHLSENVLQSNNISDSLFLNITRGAMLTQSLSEKVDLLQKMLATFENTTQDVTTELDDEMDRVTENLTRYSKEVFHQGDTIKHLSRNVSQNGVYIKQNSQSSQNLVSGFNSLQSKVTGLDNNMQTSLGTLSQRIHAASENLTHYNQRLVQQSKDISNLSKNVSENTFSRDRIQKQTQNITKQVDQIGKDFLDLKMQSEESRKNTTSLYNNVTTKLSQTMDRIRQQDAVSHMLMDNLHNLSDNVTKLQQQSQTQTDTIHNSITLLNHNVSRQNEFHNQTDNIIRLITQNLGQLEARVTKNENTSQVSIGTIGKHLQKLDKNITDLEKTSDASQSLLQHVQQLENGLNTGTSNRSKQVAFFARLSHNVVLANMGIIVYNQVETNVGNAYNPASGLFTAPVQGVYIFTISLMAQSSDSMHVKIVKNGVEVGRVYSNEDPYGTASLTVISHLQLGDKVWVQHFFETQQKGIFGDEPVNTFSGILIQ